MTASDQESFSDIMLRLVGLYREVAQAAAETYQHVKQYKPGDQVVLKADVADHQWGCRAEIVERKRRRRAVSSGNENP